MVTKSRLSSLQHHKLEYAHDVEYCPNLSTAVTKIRPTALIGVSAKPSTFTKEICEQMAKRNKWPLIFALSNPTSKAECTAAEAYEWTNGQAIFSSGSPFDPVTLVDGRTFVPGQGNNAYVFPGIGLGAIASGATKITQHDMYVASKTLASLVEDEQIKQGCFYPPLSSIRSVSAHIAAAVAENHYKSGVATLPQPSNLLAHIQSLMYNPLDG